MRRRSFRLLTAAIALAGAAIVWFVAHRLFPYHSLNHDEGVYLQQAAMLLEGQLFLRPPVEDVFRPWFFVEDGDRLYPKYAPVPAAVFALGKLAGGYRLALAGVAAGNLALVAGVVGEVFDRRTGLLAAAFVLASPLFLLDSSVFLPYAPTALCNLAFAYAYLRADRTEDARWGAAAGAAVGLAFFARPYTAVLFAAPFVVHALWTLRRDPRAAWRRQAATAGVGLLGVALALGYNAVVTGSPWLFPYRAFAPHDGLGFGRRELLGYTLRYTPGLALRSNAAVVAQFFSSWIAGGLLGAALAIGGFVAVARRRPRPRVAVLAGLFVSVIGGNVYFWGNRNLLGDLDRAGDGLIAVLGPYYHFDLLLPTAAFAAVGVVAAVRWLRTHLGRRLDDRPARIALTLVLVAALVTFGAATAGAFAAPVERNRAVTDTYETAYEPFDGGAPAGSVVLLPTPYGPWLNHPFQALRNDPGYDGRTVYATDGRPFAVADAYPDRRLFRYAYRGYWAPRAGSPRAARLQPVRSVAGAGVRLDAAFGVPPGAVGVTARLATDDGSAYYVARNVSDTLVLEVHVAGGQTWLAGEVRPVGGDRLAVAGREDVRLTVFVDYGADGFAYRLDLPVVTSDERVRALTPRIERCRLARACGGAAAYVPAVAPDGVFVRTRLTSREHNA
ncbi:MAG: ArnT family glycosyltransferase [Halobacteriales archaeon]